jgi:ABC-type antimicrobial peptide transport system permease subunit
LIDKDFPVFNVQTLQDRINDSLARERLISSLAGIFGVLALILSVTGVYGIMSHSVDQRRRELGVRMALGATPGSIIRMIVKESLLIAAAGIAIGLPAIIGAWRLISSRLSVSNSLDSLTIIVAMLIMIVVVVIAGFIPAQRAARIDPQLALRSE